MKQHKEQKSEGMNEKKEEVKIQPSIQSGDEEIVIIDSGGIHDINIKMEDQEEVRKRKTSSEELDKEENGAAAKRAKSETNPNGNGTETNGDSAEAQNDQGEKLDIKASDFFMRMIMNDPKDSQLKTIDGLISTLQCLKDNVSGVSSERSSSTASLQKQQIDVIATASSSAPNTAISAASETRSGSGSRDAQTTQTQQQVAFAFNPADSPIIGISHQARAMMQHNPTVSGIQTTPIVATSSAMNSLACSLQPTVSTPLDSNANSLVSALQLQNPVVSNAFHKMPALVAAPSIFTGQQKMMQTPKSATLQSPIMMQSAAQPTSQEMHLRNQLALHNAQISMQQQQQQQQHQQQQHALRLQAQQMQQQQQVTAQIPQPALGKPFGDLTRDELQQLVLDGIHRVHNGRATNEQVLAILAHPYLTVNGKLIQNPFFEPAQPQPVPNSISLALPQTQMQIPLSQTVQANTITLQPTQQIQFPAGIQGIQQIPIIAQNGMATMQPNMFANALTASGIVQQQQQQPQQTQMQVQSQAAMQVQQQQQKTTLMYPQTQQNGQATNANQQHLTNVRIQSI
ncbi:hypothetical protein WR25_22697 isoform B [Diploscapter pachys]|nr:hypothetical protein WR25_22697 isoform B [Diploscapter pachys]